MTVLTNKVEVPAVITATFASLHVFSSGVEAFTEMEVAVIVLGPATNPETVIKMVSFAPTLVN